jgi:NTE family protein
MNGNNVKKIALTLSGGGSRAIAFHLGCLKALKEKLLLNKVDLISTVSGGSIIGAYWAYSNGEFDEFEKKIVQLLRKGLIFHILRKFIFSKVILFELFTELIGKPVSVIPRIFFKKQIFSRGTSRSTALTKALTTHLFKDIKLTSPTRNQLSIIINATELQTGTAFRFSNLKSYCWRFGEVKNNEILVAEAVAASAAYPVFFPAFDKYFVFNKDNPENPNRVILSDGGLYDNLGLSAVLPGKDPQYSSLVFDPEYIICCNAGYGMFDIETPPYGFFSRISKSFFSVFRKNQDASMDKLFKLKELGKIKGFVLAYLGQQDVEIEKRNDNYVTRDKVNYPTNFNPMCKKKMDDLIERGKFLMTYCLENYCQDLLEGQ